MNKYSFFISFFLIFLLARNVFVEGEEGLLQSEKVGHLAIYFRKQNKVVWVTANFAELNLPLDEVFYPDSINGRTPTIGIESNNALVILRGVAILVQVTDVIVNGKSMKGAKDAVLAVSNKVYINLWPKIFD